MGTVPATTQRSKARNKQLAMLAIGLPVCVAIAIALLIVAVNMGGKPPQSNPPAFAEHDNRPTPSTGGFAPFVPSQVAVPKFPELRAPRVLRPSQVKLFQVDLRQVAGNRATEAGQTMQMRVYLPPGDHSDASLACVLVPPAGTNLLTGNEIDDREYHDETLPYAEAGMAVVHYSLDGPLQNGEDATLYELAEAYKKFARAQAGIVNGRNAVEFVLARLPQVDPNRIYSAGHSSAGTLSVLLAEFEPRIKACIAYAPCVDVEVRLAEVRHDEMAKRILPGLQSFLAESSPKRHVERLRCPTFLFHARDDSNTPYSDTAAFERQCRSSGVDVTFESVARGDHYQPMIDEGIPRAIRWLKKLESK